MGGGGRGDTNGGQSQQEGGLTCEVMRPPPFRNCVGYISV